uniref:Methyltransferase like 23 n=1 Tax=Pipistrellus kuhlii TaxID=59472 RepID=A0A7J7SEJ6_PIPKU|nr:hypothetical protein mPipKuh1_010001 [Pipistrellus kuhlii]
MYTRPRPPATCRVQREQPGKDRGGGCDRPASALSPTPCDVTSPLRPRAPAEGRHRPSFLCTGGRSALRNRPPRVARRPRAGRGARGEESSPTTTQLGRARAREPPSGEDVLHLQYGMYVWPCAVVLAQYLWFHRRSLPGKAILEIGAGVSLPGIVAAKCGAEVTLSDSSELPHCLEVCRQSCQMNDLPQVRVLGLTWGHLSLDLLTLPPQDIILAADVFFEPEDFEDILTTVYFLMQKNPKVQLWSTYQC